MSQFLVIGFIVLLAGAVTILVLTNREHQRTISELKKEKRNVRRK